MQLQLIPRGEAPVRDATPRELELIRLAGELARAQQLAAR
jgi:DNA-binding CsgD family transcriptional regulator